LEHQKEHVKKTSQHSETNGSEIVGLKLLC
jgi:hypothetical protein